MSMKNKLKRMKTHLQEETPAAPAPPEENREEGSILHLEEWKAFGAVPKHYDGETILKRTVTYPLDYIHGSASFGELFTVFDRWQQEPAFHPLHPEGRRPEDLLFFDTETTGLKGGTGTTIFLLGGARVYTDRVEVSQYFLPGPEHEVALYHYFLTECYSAENLVTYNGKSFDWPQVQTRHTLVRNQVPKLPAFGHFDLLHASRRLFAERLESCRLSVVERDILGFVRQDDTPGYLAPMLYFDYVNEGLPEFVTGILEHNEQDILSLITLYIDISKRILADGTGEKQSLAVAKWFDQQKEWAKSAQHYTAMVENGDEDGETMHRYGLNLKKQHRYAEAVSWFEKVWERNEDSRYTLEAGVELAKWEEHQAKHPERALLYAAGVQSKAERAGIKLPSGKQADLQKRLERLMHKRGRTS